MKVQRNVTIIFKIFVRINSFLSLLNEISAGKQNEANICCCLFHNLQQEVHPLWCWSTVVRISLIHKWHACENFTYLDASTNKWYHDFQILEKINSISTGKQNEDNICRLFRNLQHEINSLLMMSMYTCTFYWSINVMRISFTSMRNQSTNKCYHAFQILEKINSVPSLLTEVLPEKQNEANNCCFFRNLRHEVNRSLMMLMCTFQRSINFIYRW